MAARGALFCLESVYADQSDLATSPYKAESRTGSGIIESPREVSRIEYDPVRAAPTRKVGVCPCNRGVFWTSGRPRGVREAGSQGVVLSLRIPNAQYEPMNVQHEMTRGSYPMEVLPHTKS